MIVFSITVQDNQVDHLNETKHVAKRVGVLAPVSHVTMTLQLLMAHCLGEKYDSLLPMVVKVGTDSCHTRVSSVDICNTSALWFDPPPPVGSALSLPVGGSGVCL